MRKYNIKLQIAGAKIEVELKSIDSVLPYKAYMTHFSKPDFFVSASIEEIRIANDTYCNLLKLDSASSIVGVESQILYHKITDHLLDYDVILMHGSVVAVGNDAYMFAAPSGVGKTTRTRIWLDEYPDSYVVNGDKPYIKVTASEALAYGTPWCGKEGWNTNTAVPLRAILLLERGETDSVEEIDLRQALPFLLHQVYLPPEIDAMRKTMSLLNMLEGKTRFYKLTSTPTPESIHLIYETLRQETST